MPGSPAGSGAGAVIGTVKRRAPALCTSAIVGNGQTVGRRCRGSGRRPSPGLASRTPCGAADRLERGNRASARNRCRVGGGSLRMNRTSAAPPPIEQRRRAPARPTWTMPRRRHRSGCALGRLGCSGEAHHEQVAVAGERQTSASQTRRAGRCRSNTDASSTTRSGRTGTRSPRRQRRQPIGQSR